MRNKTGSHIRTLSDAGLVDLYLSGGRSEVIGELYTRYLHLVYGVCLKYLKNPEDSKDAVMEIFESLPGKLRRHEIREFRPWLYVITKNHCLMHLRSGKTLGEKQKIFAIEQAFIMENEENLHPMDEDDLQKDDELKDCIEKLDSGQKECILMFYYRNKCYRDIADDLKMDEKKVKSHLQNGKRNLKNCLEHKQHVRQKET